MRPIDEATLDALDGSRPADTLIVWAWRDGSLVVPDPLQIIDWSANDSAGDSVKIAQQLSLTVADPDGSLGAWRFDDPLSVAGTRLQVIYRVGGAGALNYAWFRVTGNTPDEMVDWRTINEYGLVVPDGEQEPHTRKVPIVTGVVKIETVDLTINVDRDRFESPQSPSAGATVLSEFARLTKDHFPTVTDPGVTNVSVSSQTVWDRERLESCQDLLSRIAARYRMGGDGECHIYPLNTAIVWRVEPGQALVSATRKQSLDGLYNRWVVEGKDAGNGDPVRGTAEIESGPLRRGGPHGKAPFFYSSEMITTQRQADDYALELRDRFLATCAIELNVVTTPRPELQAGDRIEVGCPLAAGYVAYIPGAITSIKSGGNPTPGPTSLTVTCSYSDVITALSRTAWAKNLTRTLPPLTWDRMPATWGTIPAVTWDNLP